MTKEEISQWFRSLQKDICRDLEEADGKAVFKEDAWEREGGGGGYSRVLSDGNVLEKGGVNFSAVHGPTPEKILKALQIQASDFYATGISIVIHPNNPHVPIIHMNTRYFEMDNGIKWFGGGIDLTPHYIVEDDASFFHKSLRDVCNRYDPEYYTKYKKWADEYFFIPHRNETRGIGGIFFDRLAADNEESWAKLFDFVKDVGKAFAPTYVELMTRNKEKTFTEEEKNWQLLRRGRYVEFNLVYDKGTKFGLDTNGRTESILMSLPPLASWEYNHEVKPGSAEHKTLSLLKKDYNWI
ncbi:MAG: oxygen-dependent coproporphyrinogen oxidase [Cytophagaceae bacterium]